MSVGLITRPRLRDVRTVPTVPVRIRRGHPLAAGLDALFLPGALLAQDLVGNWGPGIVNGVVSAQHGSAGPGVTFGTAASIAQMAPTDPQVYQMDAFFELPTGFVGPQVLCGMNQSSSVSLTSYDRVLSLDGSNVPHFYMYNGSPQDTFGSAALATGERHSMSAASDGTTLDLYADGALSGSGTGGGYSGYSTPPYWVAGYNAYYNAGSGSMSAFTGTLYAVARRIAPLSADQQAWLAAEPFCMLEPLS